MANEVFLAFGTLIAIMNPVSTAFVFNSLAHQNRKEIAFTAAVTAAVILITFFIMGSYILAFFGITIYAFKVAGGLYLSKVGFEMLSPELRKSPEQYDEASKDIAIIPLAIPLLSGPGSLATVLVMTESYNAISIILAILLACFVSWFILTQAKYLDKALGKMGNIVLERILGLIVLVIAVQFVFDGITGYLGIL